MSILPITKDKNKKDFQKNCVKLRFIDSFKFLNASLDKLASYLDKDKLKDKLKIVHSVFCKLSVENFNLFTRKGVFPNTLFASKNCRTCAYHRANYFSVRWQAMSRTITLMPWIYNRDSPFERSMSTVICTWKLMSCYYIPTFSKISTIVS